MNIFLIRHGEREDSIEHQETLGLTDLGIHQAELLGKRLTKYQIGKIYTSDTLCAAQTSEIVNRFVKADILPRHDLREIDLGNFHRGWEFLNEFHPGFAEKFSHHAEDVSYPGGESGQDVLLRSSNVISEIIESGCDNSAVMTHLGTIRVLICGILGLGQARRLFIGAPIEHGSISVIRYDRKSSRFYLHTMNDHAHLEI